MVSFKEQVFCNFEIGTIYANIDPFCGTEADGDACERLLRDHFASVVIRRPETPSFGIAVKHLWQQPGTPYFFHMEDDWEVLMPVRPADVEPRLRGKVVQVQLSQLDRHYLPRTYAYKTTWRGIFGLNLVKRVHVDRPLFATSPSFIETGFAKACAELLDPRLDPEKQLYTGQTPLTAFTRDFLNHPLLGPGRRPVVRDIGRSWLAQRGISKQIVNGVSIWEASPQQ